MYLGGQLAHQSAALDRRQAGIGQRPDYPELPVMPSRRCRLPIGPGQQTRTTTPTRHNSPRFGAPLEIRIDREGKERSRHGWNG